MCTKFEINIWTIFVKFIQYLDKIWTIIKQYFFKSLKICTIFLHYITGLYQSFQDEFLCHMKLNFVFTMSKYLHWLLIIWVKLSPSQPSAQICACYFLPAAIPAPKITSFSNNFHIFRTEHSHLRITTSTSRDHNCNWLQTLYCVKSIETGVVIQRCGWNACHF